MKPYYEHAGITIFNGDCREVLPSLEANSIDSCVTDPPYGLVSIVKRFGKAGSAPAKFGKDGAFSRASRGFMGKEWDGSGIEYSTALWAEVFRVLKPGGHVLSFGGTRTYHRMASAVEDAGFEIRDMVSWIYGSGFPKSLDVSKALDKAAGAVRRVVGRTVYAGGHIQNSSDDKLEPPIGTFKRSQDGRESTIAETDDAQRWAGWGTALKPATEPIVLARKPLSEKTVAANVLRWGTGALNIEASRVGTEQTRTLRSGSTGKGIYGGDKRVGKIVNPPGRWPANVILDEESGKMLDGQSGERKSPEGITSRGWGTLKTMGAKNHRPCHDSERTMEASNGYGDSGGASRFFYCAKASRSERGEGNGHPTVKPVALMAYLVRMVTPPGGVVLEPFLGSGTTAVACKRMGFRCVGIEKEAEYAEIAVKRLPDDMLPLRREE